ncbi:phospholipase D family protein [Paracoccus stylophorae]|uniref:Phospholipase D n=1 Tax=Paracoccus stylophorae TaxID=659350 RepID=A0ABY7SWU2_9RHOB|nr:phospholipase D family protein [Paracoccus stylophorae]WCR10857.1 phospholipase D family protein [Paracoccus stylophorae]
MTWLKWLVAGLLVLILAWLAGRLLFSVPDTADRVPEQALSADATTQLGQRAEEARGQHPGESGVMKLSDGRAALRSRLRLADAAERSIDAMYYIWHDDVSGMLLLDALRRAAQRGVRVRLLLDDNGIDAMDPVLAALNAMPTFNVRLFNPSTVRRPKWLGYVLYPLRMNRRMHNKAFIVDGAAAIVGGRNIGDEYFAVGDVPGYLDLDVLGVGKVVADTVEVFDEYWNSQPVLALEQVVAGQGDIGALDRAMANLPAASELEGTAAERLRQGQAVLEWTDVQVIADDPAKGVGRVERSGLMIARLGQILRKVDRNLDLISAYFVPGRTGARFFAELAQSGAEVRILTNSWQATDVPMVHAGYVKYRREMLEAGVKLFELKPLPDVPQGRAELGSSGLSGGSLHAKTFSVDDSRIFIGSFNFDPRSALLNCEMGFLIDSDRLAATGARSMTDRLIPRSFQPVLTQDGAMIWRSEGPDGQTHLIAHEPGLGLRDRIAVYVLNVLPIEWLL